MRDRLQRPGLAAITFSPHGGGIAAVSRLVDRVLREHCGAVTRFTLASDESRFETGFFERAAFGAAIAAAQLTGRCRWMFYTHLNLARVHRLVPARRPYVVFLHDVEAWTPLNRPMRDVLASAHLRIANSYYTARRVESANPAAGPVVACPLTLEPGALDERSGPVGGPPSRDVVIVGRMVGSERYKGHDQLLEAWPLVRAACPDARLICVGEGDDVPRLQEKARECGVADAVVFTGFVDDEQKRAIYSRAALLAMPSRREGFGLVYLEAMAAGLPCVASPHDAAAEVVVDGTTGFLVAQDDRDGLASAIVRLLVDEELRRRMGAAGRARVEREFSYERFSGRLIDLLAGVVPAVAADRRVVGVPR